MAKSIRANLELVPVKDIQEIERLDAQEVSSRPDSYVKENLLAYYIIVNTWLMIIKQWSAHGWIFVLNHIKAFGLLKAIKEFDEAADQIVHGSELSFGLARTLYRDVQANPVIYGVPLDREREITCHPMAAMLFLCRYPKRFSPVQADKLRDASLQGFVETQKRLKQVQRQPQSQYILNWVRSEISQLLDWDKLISELLDVSLKDIVFTPGVSFDTDATLVSKLRSIAKEHVEYFHMPFGIPMVASQGVEEQRYWGKLQDIEVHEVRILAVPKNYKAARVIAPENVYRQALAKRYFIISDRYLPSLINLHDQTQNQQLSYLGSLDGSLATLDLHAASDSMTSTLLWDLLPAEFMRIMTRILPTHYRYKEATRIMQSAATMGNSMTFWLESVVFLGISLAAVKFYNLFSGESDETVSVYGDDIIVPQKAALTVVEWLESLGFIVNHEKSFFDQDHHYRESCGEEYFGGICVSSRYFPRFPLEGQLGGKFSTKSYKDGYLGTHIDTMASLLDLQHKLFNLCIPASLLVSEIIREAEPRMTTSTPDQGLADLWSYEDLPKLIPAPAGEVRDGKVKKIVVKSVGEYSLDREAHIGPVTSYPTLSPDDHDGEVLVKLYNYAYFLQFGPRPCDDPVLDGLGCTAPLTSLSEARCKSEIKWAYLK